MAPSSRILLALAGVTAAALALAGALVFGGLDRLGLRSAEANMDFRLGQLSGAIEANVGLGLALPDIRVAASRTSGLVDVALVVGRVVTLNQIQTVEGGKKALYALGGLVGLQLLFIGKGLLTKRRHLRALDEVKKM